VQTGAKNIEIAVMTPGNDVSYLQAEEIEKIVEKINTEKDAEAATRSGGRGGAAATAAPGSEQVLAERPAGSE
jgi:20S proteasome subunit alpha 4